MGTSGVVMLRAMRVCVCVLCLVAVPKQLLEEAGPDTSDPFVLSDYMHGNSGWGGRGRDQLTLPHG